MDFGNSNKRNFDKGEFGFISSTIQRGMISVKAEKPRRLLAREIGLLFILLLLICFFSLLTEYFFKVQNLLNISRQISIHLIVAIGMTFLILSGEIDLSVGSLTAFVGVLTGLVIKATGWLLLGIVTGTITGCLLGLTNGLFTVYGRIQSFIVTLAMFGILRGLALVVTSGRPISNLPVDFGLIGTGYIAHFPVSSLVAVFLFLVALLILNRTEHGLNFRAIGANRETAMMAGIHVNRYRIAAFIISGLTCGVAGVITTSLLLSAQPTAAMGMELSVIAIVILGGASLAGGIGTVSGTLLGALIIGVIENGMNLMGISPFFQQIVKGTIILVALLLKRNE